MAGPANCDFVCKLDTDRNWRQLVWPSQPKRTWWLQGRIQETCLHYVGVPMPWTILNYCQMVHFATIFEEFHVMVHKVANPHLDGALWIVTVHNLNKDLRMARLALSPVQLVHCHHPILFSQCNVWGFFQSSTLSLHDEVGAHPCRHGNDAI